MHRFFVEGRHAPGERVAFDGADAHRIRDVLRLRSGDRIDVIDSASITYPAVLECARGAVTATLQQARPAQLLQRVEIVVAQGVAKGQKMDFVVEKLTELGVTAIMPFYSERTVVNDVGAGKRERWERLAVAAAQQCGRTDVPVIRAPVSWDDLLKSFEAYDTVVMPWELAPRESPVATLAALLAGKRRILAVIGPEGGFSHDEVAAAADAGARTISLGARILRTETAAMVTAALIGFLSGGMGILGNDAQNAG